MEKKLIEINGAEIFYRDYGSGKPVMLVHGFGEDGSIWQEQVEYLKANYRLIIPDLPGSGNSEILRGNDISISDYANVLKAIADAETLDEFIMIGHSMGGYISLAFAEKYPGLLRCFGLFHSSAYADDAEKIVTRQRGVKFTEGHGSSAFLKTAVPALFYDPKKNAVAIRRIMETGAKFSPQALVQYYMAMMSRHDTTHVLRSFPRPVLFVIGLHDKAVPISDGLRQCYLPGESHVHILRDSAHAGMIEESEKSNEILAQFLHEWH